MIEECKYREKEFKLQQEKRKWEEECKKGCGFEKCIHNCLIIQAIDSINLQLKRLWTEKDNERKTNHNECRECAGNT